MNPDSFILDEENQYVKARASRGDGPHSPAQGGKLIITDHRTLFFTKREVETIPHTSLVGLTVEQTPDGNLMKGLAGVLALATVGLFAYWGGVHGGDISTWRGLAAPLAGLVTGLGAGLSYRRRSESAYETLTLHTPDGDRVYSASEDASLTNASKVISKNWRRRAPKF